jgi:hypothetical protein
VGGEEEGDGWEGDFVSAFVYFVVITTSSMVQLMSESSLTS